MTARQEGCLFCQSERERVAENELAFAIRDGFPVTPLHTLSPAAMPQLTLTCLSQSGGQLIYFWIRYGLTYWQQIRRLRGLTLG
jgi:hypothetical protein